MDGEKDQDKQIQLQENESALVIVEDPDLTNSFGETEECAEKTIGRKVPSRKCKKRRKRRPVSQLPRKKRLLDDDEGNFEVAEVREIRYRGNLESNIWARRVCKERRTRLSDYLETLKGYESVEPVMYKIGRSYDKLLSTLTTPLKISSCLESSTEDSDADNNDEFDAIMQM